MHARSTDTLIDTAAATAPTRVTAAGDLDLSSGWNSFLGLFPSSLTNALAVIGIAMIVWFVVRWLHEHRRDSLKLKTLPWIGIGFGLLFAAPKTVIPILLFVVDIVGGFLFTVLQNFLNLIGRG